jgi:electron transfer flavoprotein beta subunit
VLAAAIARLEPDLVLAGMASTDAGTSVVPAMIAARLGLPQLTFAGSLEIDGAGPGALVRIQRDGDTSTEVIESALPALVSVTDQINEPRYPNFKGIMGAKKKPVEVLGLAELGLAADQVGGAAAWSAVVEITKRPGRQAGQRITDDGTAGTQLVAYLAGAKLI